MHKIFTLGNSTKIHFRYQGLGAGLNYSEVYEPNAVAYLRMLRLQDGAASSTRLVAQVNYEVRIASVSVGNIDIAAAALITNESRHMLLFRPADCIPIVLFCGEPRVLALIHGGRRELDNDVVAKTLKKITETFQIPPGKLTAYLGPGIKQKSYRLPESVRNTLIHANWEPYILTSGHQIMIDTFGFARSELLRGGMIADAITLSTTDTAANPNYFSHYSEVRGKKSHGLNGCSVVISS